MRRRSIAIGLTATVLLVAGTVWGRAAARDLTEIGPREAHFPGHAVAMPTMDVGFAVVATEASLSAPGYEACLARIGAADALATVTLGDGDPSHGFSQSDIRLVTAPFRERLLSVIQHLSSAGSVGPFAPSVGPKPKAPSPPTKPNPGGGAGPKPAPTGPNPPGATAPSGGSAWAVTFLTGFSCWWGTCKYTCANVRTCFNSATCFSNTCKGVHTCNSSLAPNACGGGDPNPSSVGGGRGGGGGNGNVRYSQWLR